MLQILAKTPVRPERDLLPILFWTIILHAFSVVSYSLVVLTGVDMTWETAIDPRAVLIWIKVQHSRLELSKFWILILCGFQNAGNKRGGGYKAHPLNS